MSPFLGNALSDLMSWWPILFALSMLARGATSSRGATVSATRANPAAGDDVEPAVAEYGLDASRSIGVRGWNVDPSGPLRRLPAMQPRHDRLPCS